MRKATDQNNVHTRVGVSVTLMTMAGKRSDFTVEEQELLRVIGNEVKRGDRVPQGKDHEAISGVAFGTILGIEQQNVSRWLTGNGGIGRTTANALAKYLGYRDAEELLLEEGLMRYAAGVAKGNVWHSRDSAMRIAERLGYSKEAIDSVVSRWKEKDHARQPIKWWLSLVVMEDLRQAADATPPRPRLVGSGT